MNILTDLPIILAYITKPPAMFPFTILESAFNSFCSNLNSLDPGLRLNLGPNL